VCIYRAKKKKKKKKKKKRSEKKLISRSMVVWHVFFSSLHLSPSLLSLSLVVVLVWEEEY